MDIYLFNNLTSKKEKFEKPLDQEVLMYNCGPTVYNYAHLGNLRSYVFADLLHRMFEYNDYKVKQVINITDVGHLASDSDTGEDKVEKEAKKTGKSAEEISQYYTEAFFEDLIRLNIQKDKILFPKASSYIEEQKEMISDLEKKGFTYKTKDGVYFDTSKYPEYINLFGIDRSNIDENFARIENNPEKRNHLDFALWKFSKPKDKRLQEWDSPWGKGFPGWHIECSAMNKAILGDTIDVHTGGIDHIPVHHTNEIAQSTCANDKPLARYWMHNAFLNVESGKMAKSENNFLRLKTLEEKNIDPIAFRYLLLTAHYSSPLQFSWESLEAGEVALKKLRQKISEYKEDSPNSDSIKISEYKDNFKKLINDNLDTPKALALIWQMIKDDSVSDVQKKELILDFDKVLGLGLNKIENIKIPSEILALVEEREKARKEKNWKNADKIRLQIENLGFDIKDTEEGVKISPK